MSHAPTHVFPVHTNFYATCTCVSCALAPCHHVVYRPHHVRVLQSGRPVHFDLQPGLHGQAARQDHRGDAGRVSPCSSFSSSSVPFSSSLCSRDNLGETNSYCNFSFFFTNVSFLNVTNEQYSVRVPTSAWLYSSSRSFQKDDKKKHKNLQFKRKLKTLIGH